MPYKDPDRRRQYQRDYYHDRNIAHRRPDVLPRNTIPRVTKSTRFIAEEYQNLISVMLEHHRRSGKPIETFSWNALAQEILISWGAEKSRQWRQERLDGPAF